MKKRLPTIVVNRNTPGIFETFSPLGNVRMLETHGFTPASVQDADILIVRSETIVDRNLLEGSSVRFVGTVTIGTDHIDVEYLRSRGVEFVSAPGSNANSVAEYTAAALLVWSQSTGQSLKGKGLGIVGVGNVGSRVAAVARSLGMVPVLNDPPLARKTGDKSYRRLEDLMGSDIITLHVPLSKEGSDATWHLFDGKRLDAMNRGSVLVNTARGAVVDGQALLERLESGHLGSAILDVWENEPDISMTLLDRALIGTPHISGYSLDGKLNALRAVYHEVCRFLDAPAQDSTYAGNVPNERSITVTEEVTSEAAVVREAVRQAYNIEHDDAALRKVKDVPEWNRPTYFAGLRSSYRIRREFMHQTVELLPGQSSAAETLRNLGFRVIKSH